MSEALDELNPEVKDGTPSKCDAMMPRKEIVNDVFGIQEQSGHTFQILPLRQTLPHVKHMLAYQAVMNNHYEP
jgi:hypothetical protein